MIPLRVPDPACSACNGSFVEEVRPLCLCPRSFESQLTRQGRARSTRTRVMIHASTIPLQLPYRSTLGQEVEGGR
jgi:hypothetical protein